MQKKSHQKYVLNLLSIFICGKCVLDNKTLDQTPDRNGFFGQDQIKTRHYVGCYFLEQFLRSFDLEMDILTLKMKLNY